MKPAGLFIVAAAFIPPAFWFTELAGRFDTVAIVSQYFGASALIAMGLAQLLATRAGLLERIFGGLDRSYLLHKWLAVSAITLAWLHDTVDAEIDALGRAGTLSEFGETFGEFAFYGLVILIALTLVTFIPYQLWRFTHRFIGFLFALAAAHFLLIQKPFANLDPLGIYISAFCALGLGSYLYLLVGYARFPGPRRYTVTDRMDTGGAVAIRMEPAGRALRHKPGQFAFIEFDQDGLREKHPFTISSAPSADGALRFSIRPLGDYSIHLTEALVPDTAVSVFGPHGRFLRPARGPQAWIAGGIGVTPFLAWAQTLDKPLQSPIRMFYCVRDRLSAPHLAELEDIAQRVQGFDLIIVEASSAGRLTAKQVLAAFDGTEGKLQVSFCGPSAMRRQLQQQFRTAGVPARRFHYEVFELRAGIGFRRLIAWAEARWRRRKSVQLAG